MENIAFNVNTNFIPGKQGCQDTQRTLTNFTATDSSFNTFDDSRDYNMNSDDENMFKAEVKLEEESGDEFLDFDNSNNGDGRLEDTKNEGAGRRVLKRAMG